MSPTKAETEGRSPIPRTPTTAREIDRAKQILQESFGGEGVFRNWLLRRKVESRGKLEESGIDLARARAEFETFMVDQITTRERYRLDIEQMKQDIGITKENINFLKFRNKLADKIIEGIDITDMDMKQVFVLIEMLKEASNENDLLITEAKARELGAEARKKEAEAKGLEAEAERKHLTKEEQRQKMKKAGIKIDD
ncbi:hypothetical protein LCGC14_2635620 [marine sediment metagenome]|uniref:Uncharacterized protein n=1 Tax=marine sediment metagenome TaxID=412755 RepID=A0A0F9CRC2_9ZZZZ